MAIHSHCAVLKPFLGLNGSHHFVKIGVQMAKWTVDLFKKE